jgi:hypothetical protein
MHLFETTTAEQALELGKVAAMVETLSEVRVNVPSDTSPRRKR